MLGEHRLKLGLVQDRTAQPPPGSVPGLILPDYTVACAEGVLEIHAIQAPGGRMLDLPSFLNGFRAFAPGARLAPVPS